MSTSQADPDPGHRLVPDPGEIAQQPAQIADFRTASAAVFDEQAFGPSTSSKRSLNWGAALSSCGPVMCVDLTELREGAYSLIDASQTLLLSHVLRHSSCSLQWHDTHGRSFQIQPGGLVVAGGSTGQMVQLAPVEGDGSCECLNVSLRLAETSKTVTALGAHEFPFFNSAEACVRVILGRYGEVCSSATPSRCNVSIYDIDIVPAAVVDVPVAPDRWSVAIVTSGELRAGEMVLGRSAAAVFLGNEHCARVSTLSGVSLLWLDLPYASVPIRAVENPAFCQGEDCYLGW